MVRRDATLGDRLVLELLMAGERHNREAVRRVFDAASGWNQRAFLVDELAESDGCRAMIEQWGTDEPDDALAVLLHGALAGDESLLTRAAGLDPASPLPWQQLLRSGRDAGVSVTDLQHRFDETTARTPELYAAFEAMVDALASVGSPDEVFEFVERSVRRASIGSPVHSMVVAAHLEQATASGQDLIRYFGQGNVISDVGDAAERSIWSQAFVDDRSDTSPVRARNMFLLGHILNRDVASADRQVTAIGQRVSARPWNRFSDEDPAQIMTDIYAKLDVVRRRNDPRRGGR